MTTPWAEKRTPKLLRATYLADQEFLLEETRSSKLLYFPGPVLWFLVFGALTYLTAAPRVGLPHSDYYENTLLGGLANVLHQSLSTVEDWGTILLLILLLVGLLWLGVRFLRWSRTVYAVTNRRVIIQRGIVGRDFDEIPVTQIRGVDVKQSVGQRALGYGTIRVTAEGGSNVGNEDWKGIPKPFRFQKLVESATERIQSGAGAAPAATGVR